jgi:1,4-dihydroxy-2-naphthoate polyprenyltransferase
MTVRKMSFFIYEKKPGKLYNSFRSMKGIDLVDPKQMSSWQIWRLAIRPKTLPAAAAPVLAASALAFHDGVFRTGPALACLLTALLLQIAANLANDVFDFQRGADTQERLGPVRVTQAGLLAPGKVKRGMWVCFAVAAFLGLYVAWASSWLILLVGAAAVLAALAYSGGPLPYGYYGLGELGVFLFFGVAAVCGTYYGQAKLVTTAAIFISIAMGCLSSAILVVNNLRDIQTDQVGGKKTLAVLMGAGLTRWEYFGLIAFAYIIPVLLWIGGFASTWVLLAFGSIPLAVRTCLKANRMNGKALNALLAETGQLELVFALLLGLGLIIL